MVTSLTALHLSYKAREIFPIFAIVLKLLQPVLFQVILTSAGSPM